jgi:hypothetical protein
MKKVTILVLCLAVVGILVIPASVQQLPNVKIDDAEVRAPALNLDKDRDRQPDPGWLRHVHIHSGGFSEEPSHARGVGAFTEEAGGISRTMTEGGGRGGVALLEGIVALFGLIGAAIAAAVTCIANAIASIFRPILGLFGWRKHKGTSP